MICDSWFFVRILVYLYLGLKWSMGASFLSENFWEKNVLNYKPRDEDEGTKHQLLGLSIRTIPLTKTVRDIKKSKLLDGHSISNVKIQSEKLKKFLSKLPNADPSDLEDYHTFPNERPNTHFQSISDSNPILMDSTIQNKSTKKEDHKSQRAIKIVQNWLSFYPFPWMTKFEGSGDKNDTQSANMNPGNKTPIKSLNEDTSQIHFSSFPPQRSDKIKRLLNLFNIVKFNNVPCDANGIRGVCIHRTECEGLKGKFTMTCAQQQGVCCYDEKTCGDYSKEYSTYFANQGFPVLLIGAPNVCILTMEKADSSIRQFRLDFLEFELREPSNGTCFFDRLVITGQNVNNAIPEICGANTGQHLYVDIEDSGGPYKLSVVVSGEYFPRRFKIKITQLSHGDENLAPNNCLQYHSESSGVLKSFNYQNIAYDGVDEIVPVTGYFNDLNYAICIKKMPGYCSISYENHEWENSTQPTFQLINTDSEGEALLQPRQAGAETFDCPDDYLIVGGMKLCGEKFNDGSVEADLTKNYPVTDTSNGPFVVNVRTDGSETGRGFSLTFRQNLCSV